MRGYFDDLVKQAAVVSVDWWDKLKPLRINIKGKNVPQYSKPIPEFIDEFGVFFQQPKEQLMVGSNLLQQ